MYSPGAGHARLASYLGEVRMPAYTLIVNGQSRRVEAEPGTPLLWVLRDGLGLTGTKFGCGVAQCGACQSGMLITAAELLARKPKPTDEDIDAALGGHICRCGTYQRIRRAVHR